ncbi:MAG: FtsX-like permease family protein, partial [Actinophytocola sp.]|nr:FtsX-like permease family protein [Actinophytocola sp.]
MRASFVFSEVFTGLRRNVTMTIAMILTTAISLALLGFGLLAVKTVDLTKDRYLDELEVAIFLNDDVSKNDQSCKQQPCEGLKQQLESNPVVDSVLFRNQEDALVKFKEIFENEPELIEAATAEALPASLIVTLSDPQRSDVIVQEFSEKEGVFRVNDGGEVVDRLVEGLSYVRDVAFGSAVVLLGAALLLIANMIQISAFTRRAEVGIMRLVGATRWYTQLPFLLEAMFAGLIGAILAIGALLSMQLLTPDAFSAQLENIMRFPGTVYTALVVSPALLLT